MSDNSERIRAARFQALPEPQNMEQIATGATTLKEHHHGGTMLKEHHGATEDQHPEDLLVQELHSVHLERDSATPSSMPELLDRISDATDSKDPLHWLTIQIKEEREKNSSLVHENAEMRKKLGTLEYSLAQWKLNAQETTDHLRRVVANRDKPNYVDAFYDTKTKRVLQALAEENMFLKSELNNDEGLVKNISGLSELRNQNKLLSEQLRIRTTENHELQDQIRVFGASDSNVEGLKDKIVELNNSMLLLTVENSTLRNHTNKQMEILTFLKSHFSKLRNEFLRIFAEHVASDNGEDLLEQLKSMDGEAAPTFLMKPLIKRSASETPADTSIVETAIEPAKESPAPMKRVQRDQDSGFDSLNDEQRELVKISRELELSKTEVNRLVTDNSRLRSELKEHGDELRKMKQVVVSANEQCAMCRGEVTRLRGENERLRKERDDAKNEALSWHAALEAFQNEGAPQPSPQQQQLPSQQQFSSTSFRSPRQTLSNVREPFHTSPFNQPHFRPEAILVRDGGQQQQQPSKTSHPTESQETSFPPRAGGSVPICHSLSEPADPPSSAPPPLPPRKGGSLDRNVPVRYFCQKCKKNIAAREINEHKEYCDGYLDLRT